MKKRKCFKCGRTMNYIKREQAYWCPCGNEIKKSYSWQEFVELNKFYAK